MCMVNEEGKAGASRGLIVSAGQARLLLAALGLALGGMSATGAQAESRTISMYHIHTKERITVTYWKDGRFIPSALRKLNWFLRDWRRNKAVRMDPRTIDLIWKLHADLGSKEPVHIICGHRSAATNAMLRRIGRRVARRSRHITGQAIDFKFPDVPTWKVRNLALAYGIGGVGYYGRNGFVHVDTGKVRHWPRLPQYKLASIIRKYRRMIGRGYHRGNDYIMLAKKNAARGNFNRRANGARRERTGQVLLASASRKATAHRPIPLPGVKPALLAAGTGASSTVPTPRARPYQVLVLAASRMEVTPAAAPATLTNFAPRNSVRDPIGVVIASLPQETADPALLEQQANAESATASARPWPKVMRSGKGDLAVALADGTETGLPTLEKVALRGIAHTTTVARNGKSNPLNAPLGLSPNQLARRDGAPVLGATVQQAGMFWPGMRVRAVPDRVNRPQRVNRAGKGDLLTASRLPANIRKAALEEGAIEAGNLRPLRFR